MGAVDETRSLVRQIAETDPQLARSVGILSKDGYRITRR